MTRIEKLKRIEKLLRTIQRLEAPFANAIREFSHAHAGLDRVNLTPMPVKQKEAANRRAVRQVESATEILLEEIETPVPSEWDRTVTQLATLGVERNFHSIGTARHLYGNLMSYMTYLGLQAKCEREGKAFPNRWAEPMQQFAVEFKTVIDDVSS